MSSDACADGSAIWRKESLEQHADIDGVTALDACCMCGGRDGSPTCHDFSRLWTDAEGDVCDWYVRDAEVCASGKVLDATFDFSEWADPEGRTALGAYCECSGGDCGGGLGVLAVATSPPRAFIEHSWGSSSPVAAGPLSEAVQAQRTADLAGQSIPSPRSHDGRPPDADACCLTAERLREAARQRCAPWWLPRFALGTAAQVAPFGRSSAA